jgi:hypothetical protein
MLASSHVDQSCLSPLSLLFGGELSAANAFRICSSPKSTHNPLRIRTSKIKDLKPCRMSSSEKRWGEGSKLLTRIRTIYASGSRGGVIPSEETEGTDLVGRDLIFILRF